MAPKGRTRVVRFGGGLIGVSRAINPWDASRRWTCYPSSSVCLIDGFPVARQYSTSYFRFSSHVAASLCLSTHDWPSSPLHVTHASSIYTFFHPACAIHLALCRAYIPLPCLFTYSRGLCVRTCPAAPGPHPSPLKAACRMFLWPSPHRIHFDAHLCRSRRMSSNLSSSFPHWIGPSRWFVLPCPLAECGVAP